MKHVRPRVPGPAFPRDTPFHPSEEQNIPLEIDGTLEVSFTQDKLGRIAEGPKLPILRNLADDTRSIVNGWYFKYTREKLAPDTSWQPIGKATTGLDLKSEPFECRTRSLGLRSELDTDLAELGVIHVVGAQRLEIRPLAFQPAAIGSDVIGFLHGLVQ